MPASVRQQLTLFLPPAAAATLAIEAMRQVLDPVQSDLIGAHITLCREDELPAQAEICQRLAKLNHPPIQLTFGLPEAFSGHGILLNCIDGIARFQALRQQLLGSSAIRKPMPHLTLAHPRNPRAPGNSLAWAIEQTTATLPQQAQLVFPTICLIEQSAGQAWQVLYVHTLESGALLTSFDNSATPTGGTVSQGSA